MKTSFFTQEQPQVCLFYIPWQVIWKFSFFFFVCIHMYFVGICIYFVCVCVFSYLGMYDEENFPSPSKWAIGNVDVTLEIWRSFNIHLANVWRGHHVQTVFI